MLINSNWRACALFFTAATWAGSAQGQVSLLREHRLEETLGARHVKCAIAGQDANELILADANSAIIVCTITGDGGVSGVQRFVPASKTLAGPLPFTRLEGLHDWSIEWLASVPGSKLLYVGNGMGSIVCLERRETLRVLERTDVSRALTGCGSAAVFSQDGRFLYVCNPLGSVAVFARDPQNGRLTLGQTVGDADLVRRGDTRYRDVNWDKDEIRLVEGLGSPRQIAVPPRNKCLFVASAFQDHLCRLGRNSQHPTLAFAGVASPSDEAQVSLPMSMSITQDGQNLVVGTRGLGASIFQETANRTSFQFLTHVHDPSREVENGSSLEGVVFSRDGKHLFAASCSSRAVLAFDRLDGGRKFEFRARLPYALPTRTFGFGTDFGLSVIAGPSDHDFMVLWPAFDLLRVYRINEREGE